jgi:RNA polymerase sigma-70 factor, ECF subfamily
MEVTAGAMETSAALDEAAIRAFLAGDHARIVRAVTLVAGSRAAAEDAVAEALARAWERSDHGERIESLPAWVTRVALNLATSRLRRLRVEARHRSVASDEVVAAPVGDRVDVERALATLPRREREVTVLRYHLQLDVAEIATTLGVTDGTVKTLLHRARRHLATALGEPEDEETDR